MYLYIITIQLNKFMSKFEYVKILFIKKYKTLYLKHIFNGLLQFV